MNKSSFVIILYFFLVFSPLSGAEPQAVKGVLDLRKNSFDNLIDLQGELKFRPLTPSADFPVKEYNYLTVPGRWNEITGEAYSSGEYQLKILMPENAPSTLGLYFPELSQAMEVEVDGRVIISCGKLLTGKTDYTNLITSVPVQDEMDLKIRLRNTQYRKGGLIYVPFIGSVEKIHALRARKIWLEGIGAGFLLLAAIYHFLLFHYDSRRYAAFFLGLSALLMMLRGMVTGENTIKLLFPGFSWILDYHLEYVCPYLIGGTFLLFLRNTFPLRGRLIKLSSIIIPALSVFFALISLVLPVKLLSQTVMVLQLFLLFCGGVSIYIFVLAFIERQTGAFLFILGGLVFYLTLFIDSFYYHGIGRLLLNISLTGMVIFVLTQAAVLSRLHSNAMNKAEQLSKNLEKEVAQQTADLQRTNYLLRKEVEQRKKVESRLEILSTTDPLTGAANRLKFTPHLEQAHHVFNRYGKLFGLIMFDIDHFKLVNDQYGHGAGDELLKAISLISERQLRQSDIFARWGGEEFMILMPEMDLAGSLAAAERLRQAIEEFNFPVAGKITASFGVTVPFEGEIIIDDILKRVDENLYKAKEQGRNRVVG